MSSAPIEPVWDDPRVARGLQAQLASRQERLDAGERPLGWKVGFGAPAAMERVGISAPLIGFLTESTRVEPGGEVDIGGWTKPLLEPEIAVHLGADLGPGADRATAEAAIAGLGPAFELVDFHLPFDDLEAIVAANIFQRAVVLGDADQDRAGGSAAGLRARIARNGEPEAETDNPLELVGDLVDLTRHAADLLGSAGARLRAGEVLITGTIVPPLPLNPGDRVDYALEPLGRVAVSCAG
jgi:2-keto-4-pentenoate hydratase